MGVIYIGDRQVGKTALATELANSKFNYVNVSNFNYESLKGMLFDESEGRFRATNTIDDRYLEVRVKLPTGQKQFTVDWVDTPGEIWRQAWQNDNPDEWKNFLKAARCSEGILLTLPPYREILKSYVDSNDFINKQQWCNRFERWADFFCQDCSKTRHLAICLNKADLFCEVEHEAYELAYNPEGSQKNWLQRHNYVYARYFKPIHAQIERINQSISGLSVRCFITSIHNRPLLELPWIYLGSFLAK